MRGRDLARPARRLEDDQSRHVRETRDEAAHQIPAHGLFARIQLMVYFAERTSDREAGSVCFFPSLLSPVHTLHAHPSSQTSTLPSRELSDEKDECEPAPPGYDKAIIR